VPTENFNILGLTKVIIFFLSSIAMKTLLFNQICGAASHTQTSLLFKRVVLTFFSISLASFCERISSEIFLKTMLFDQVSIFINFILL